MWFYYNLWSLFMKVLRTDGWIDQRMDRWKYDFLTSFKVGATECPPFFSGSKLEFLVQNGREKGGGRPNVTRPLQLNLYFLVACYATL